MSVRQTGRQISVEQSFSFGVQHRHRICPVSKPHDGLRRRSIARPFRQTHAVRISGLGEIRPVLLDLVGKRSVAVGPRPVDGRLRLEHIGKFRGMDRADLDRVRSWGEPGEAVNIRGLCPRRRLVAMSSARGLSLSGLLRSLAQATAFACAATSTSDALRPSSSNAKGQGP